MGEELDETRVMKFSNGKESTLGFDDLGHAIMKFLESKISKLGFSMPSDEKSSYKAP